MSIFRKKKAGEAGAEIPAVQETPRRTVQRASLTSGRMAALFQRLYRWVFSVNVTAGVYQIESGEDTFAREPLPIRGYYSALLAHLAHELPEGERETFARMFSAESIGRAMESGSTSLRGIFSAYELGVEDSEGRERPPVGAAGAGRSGQGAGQEARRRSADGGGGDRLGSPPRPGSGQNRRRHGL